MVEEQKRVPRPEISDTATPRSMPRLCRVGGEYNERVSARAQHPERRTDPAYSEYQQWQQEMREQCQAMPGAAARCGRRHRVLRTAAPAVEATMITSAPPPGSREAAVATM